MPGKRKEEKKKRKTKKRGTEIIDKDEIEQLGLNAIKEYFEVDIRKVKPDDIKNLHSRAKLGMRFEAEFNKTKRAVESNYIKVFRLMAEDKKEMKKLIKKSMPQYYPGA